MLIGVSGKARSGKDTFATMLAKALQKQTGQAYVLMAYAHELKIRVQKDFDLSYEQLWGNEKEIEDKRYVQGRWSSNPDKKVYWTPREIMQSYGQFFRTIHYDFWVEELFRIVKEKEFENVIVTDVRHINEVDAVVDRGGYHVRVTRQEDENVHNREHISETALDDEHRVDFTVMNRGTLEDLAKSAEDVVRFLVDSEKAFDKLNINKKES